MELSPVSARYLRRSLAGGSGTSTVMLRSVVDEGKWHVRHRGGRTTHVLSSSP